MAPEIVLGLLDCFDHPPWFHIIGFTGSHIGSIKLVPQTRTKLMQCPEVPPEGSAFTSFNPNDKSSFQFGQTACLFIGQSPQEYRLEMVFTTTTPGSSILNGVLNPGANCQALANERRKPIKGGKRERSKRPESEHV